MKTPARISVAACVIAMLGAVGWHFLNPREPVYQGQRLSHWLTKYNQAGTIDETQPISEAICAMGTNSLPFLLAHLNHTDSPIQQRLFMLAGKLRFLKLPVYGA